jgi:hypothetical protein
MRDLVLAWTYCFAAMIMILCLSAGPAVAQTSDQVGLRTPDGQPDLEGIWTFSTITPLERPSALEGRDVLSPEEAAAFEEAENRRQNRDLVDPKVGGAGYAPESEGGVVAYNEFWYDRGNQLTEDRRTSLIVDPPDGRIPPLTAEAEEREAARQAYGREHPADSWLDINPQVRCLMANNAGPPMVPGAYNNNVQILQTRDHVVILNEMIHRARVVRPDGSPPLPQSVLQWAGASRAYWEGETLVVETNNFRPEKNFRGSSKDLHLVERFTRVDEDTLLYEFTAEDPTTWTRPWTAVVPMSPAENPLFEFACHEGNYAMSGILGGARVEEKKAAETGTN